MDKREEYMNILQRFKQEHADEYGITSIGIFGSVARGEHTDDSDVDVLVEAPGIDLFTCVGIRNQLEKMMGVPVDLVTKSEFMRPRFKARVEREVVYV
jgi:predicted nucleotidyltransferase